ncbi:single-stranded-DNA-specific exonuclease RecJ [Aureitalea marina]|uniref:Single-stranded-DNA-specific exonuclease RecJ n=1 Tax=Aureitalea marina TaxID=930804 RepID=A0A2S7KS15_9FLAO|nr:single-stranded-DNA-specific exonuclease RecJ [Aureitalea marina]PQB05406.1 single-stranded-DNA-specific exonuclease RecJ [Aureitalea marina]
MRWKFRPEPPKETIERLVNELSVSTIIAKLLAQRGIETYQQAKDFFRPGWDQLHDPFLMKDMDKAVDRVDTALKKGENILVYGDYDVDGTSSVAMMFDYLSSRSEQIATYIPDRYTEGYGVSLAGIDYASDNEFSLIIALDCGIKAIEQVKYAEDQGIDFIICDHHLPGNQLPDAVAVLDPKRGDCDYPYKELCGCGVGFKLIQALEQREERPKSHLSPYLDLVATAIGADIVPLTGENRNLMALGIQQIMNNPRPGIKAVQIKAGRTVSSVSDVVFLLAPRINAAGRMKHGNEAVRLLTSTDMDAALQCAEEIEQFNKDRKETDKEISLQALDQIEELGEQQRATTVVFDPNWHKGVIGIVASRLIETYYRPTVVFTQSGDKLAASVRSVKGFDVHHALEQCADLMVQFGGHKYAAGLTLDPKNYQAFKERFEKVVSESITEESMEPELLIDELIHLGDISPKFYRILKQFAPFGPSNGRPVFVSDNLRLNNPARQVGADRSHLKLSVRQTNSDPIEGIGFGLGDKLELASSETGFQAVFSLDENHWNGQTSLQLKFKDIKAL